MFCYLGESFLKSGPVDIIPNSEVSKAHVVTDLMGAPKQTIFGKHSLVHCTTHTEILAEPPSQWVEDWRVAQTLNVSFFSCHGHGGKKLCFG